MDDEKNPIYKKTWFLILVFLLGLTLLEVIGVSEDILTAITIVATIFLGIKIYTKNKQKQQDIKDKELDLINQGYKKICSNFFVDEENYRVNILDNIYGFSQIIDYEIIETSTNIAIEITTENFEEPIITLNLIERKNISSKKAKYENALNDVKNVEAVLKIIISKNKEEYYKDGNVTKIEHRYTVEKTIEDEIKELGKLYKEGLLTEYEFATKKMELLEKLKK